MELTREIAYAAATDEANRRMRKAGRTHWTRGDYNLACRTFNQLWPVERQLDTLYGEGWQGRQVESRWSEQA